MFIFTYTRGVVTVLRFNSRNILAQNVGICNEYLYGIFVVEVPSVTDFDHASKPRAPNPGFHIQNLGFVAHYEGYIRLRPKSIFVAVHYAPARAKYGA